MMDYRRRATDKDDYHSDVEACKNIFVTWAWGIGICCGLVGVLVLAAWGASAAWADINHKLAESEQMTKQQIDQIEAKIITQDDADTIKTQQKKIIDLLQKGTR
jgi:hypothetical protein